MPINPQASPSNKGEGRRLRWARNVVKRWMKACNGGPRRATFGDAQIIHEVEQGRYERACALIIADKLRNS